MKAKVLVEKTQVARALYLIIFFYYAKIKEVLSVFHFYLFKHLLSGTTTTCEAGL